MRGADWFGWMRGPVRLQFVCGCFVWLALAASASAQGAPVRGAPRGAAGQGVPQGAATRGAPVRGATIPTPLPTVETILERMAQARAENRERFRSYIVTREYTLFGKDRDKSKAEVTAEVTFVPPNSKQFSIQQSTGSGLGERLVRRMLEGETEIVEDYGSTDISPANYDFRFAGEQLLNNHRCYVLELLPKRKNKTLIHGKVWVDVDSYLLRRLEGEPAKSSSWWLRNVRIAFTYSGVAGMWLQTASEYTTNVRIFGQYAMTSRDVGYETAGPGGAGPRTPLESSYQQQQDCPTPCVSASENVQAGAYPHGAK